MHSVPPSKAAGSLLWIAAALVVAVRLLFWGLTGFTIEDSYISLRYAENLAAGLGLVYNPGERVFGASTPLYVLTLAAFVKLGLPTLAVAKALAVAADAATMLLWGRWLLRETGTWGSVTLFGLLFGLSPMIVPVTTSGMETSFALLLLSIALIQAMRPPDEGRAPEWLALGVPLGVLMLIRPDGALAAAVILGLRWWRTRRLPLPAGVTAALIVLPWLVAAQWYYGSVVPHSIPAKAAAYNLHRSSIWPNFFVTLGELVPVTKPWWRLLLSTLLCPFFLAGIVSAWRNPRLRPVAVLFPVWWAYLVFPKTLIFTWYFPLLLLPGYVLTAYGFGQVRAGALPRFRLPERWAVVAVCLIGLVIGGTLVRAVGIWGRVQNAERTVRTAIGVWLRENTPQTARIAMEPIGYIGYHSRRRILDEVGLVSPEMVPLNRAGDGWFAAMLRRYRPDYVVERSGYLIRNYTLNSGVRLFAENAERDRFLAEYEPLATFGDPKVPFPQDYRFVIFGRRTAENAGLWARVNRTLSDDARLELQMRALLGPVDLDAYAVARIAEEPSPEAPGS